MNSQSENESLNQQPQTQTKSVPTVDRLKSVSRTTLSTLGETPYQPIVYAIPKEDWKQFCDQLREAVTFQPTLYEKIAAIGTREETTEDWNDLMQGLYDWSEDLAKTLNDVGLVIQTESQEAADSVISTQRRIYDLLVDEMKWDGESREKFLSGLDSRETARLDAYTAEMKKSRKYLLLGAIGTICSSGILSLILSLVLR